MNRANYPSLIGQWFMQSLLFMDAYSRKIVGWHLDKTMEARGSVCALEMAIRARAKAGGTLVHHRPATRSDRGVQYCSWKYVDLLRNHDIPSA